MIPGRQSRGAAYLCPGTLQRLSNMGRGGLQADVAGVGSAGRGPTGSAKENAVKPSDAETKQEIASASQTKDTAPPQATGGNAGGTTDGAAKGSGGSDLAVPGTKALAVFWQCYVARDRLLSVLRELKVWDVVT